MLLQYAIIQDQDMITFVCRSLLFVILLIAASILILFSSEHASGLQFHSERIRIFRDQYNIPYVDAQTRLGFLYGWGHSTAEDRLFQISFKVKLIQGRLSQFLGERTLQMDKFMRQLNLDYWADRAATNLYNQNITEYQQMDAFVQGINDCVAKKLVLPLDFYLTGMKWENWTVGTMLSVHKVVEWSQSTNIGEQYFRSMLLADYSKEEVDRFMPNTKQLWAFDSKIIVKDEDLPNSVRTNHSTMKQKLSFKPIQIDDVIELGLFPYLSSVDGSNSWAVAGQHTQSGRPILSNDPHLENNIPCQWYQIRGKYSKNEVTYEFSGVSIPGVPLSYGRTNYFSSAITTIQYDNQDLYKQQIQGNKYLIDGKWLDLKVRQEIITVKKEGKLVQETYVIRQTHRGPLIHYIFSPMGSFQITDDISLIWTGFHDDYKSFTDTTRYMQYDNLQDITFHLKHGTKFLFNVNILMITNDDHIIYQQGGIYPIRPNPQLGQYIKDGTNSNNDWIGMMSPQDRLQIVDPACGYIFSANNKIASDQYYGGYLNYTFYTARGDRINQILSGEIEGGRKINVQFMKNMIVDTEDIFCKQVLHQITSVLSEADAVLHNFDCNFNEHSYMATMYEVFFFELNNLIKPHKTQNFSAMTFYTYQQYIFNYFHEVYQGKHDNSKMKAAWNNMLINLQTFYKTEDRTKWRWGLYHRDVMMHIPMGLSPLSKLYNRQFEGRGNLNTLNLGKMNKQELGQFEVTHRPNLRMIHTYNQGSWWIIDSGSSQNILSSHYDDQWKLFKDNQWIEIKDVSREQLGDL